MTAPSDNPLAIVRAAAQALLAWCEYQERSQAPRPEWYDSHSYPFGPRRFRRHIAKGMPATKIGTSYRVRVEDAEAFWASKRATPKPRPTRPMTSQEERWAAAGLRAVGGAR